MILFIAPEKESVAEADCNLAAQTVSLLAPTLCMGPCFSGFIGVPFRRKFKLLLKEIRIPPDQKICTVLLAGYPAREIPGVPNRMQRPVMFI